MNQEMLLENFYSLKETLLENADSEDMAEKQAAILLSFEYSGKQELSEEEIYYYTTALLWIIKEHAYN